MCGCPVCECDEFEQTYITPYKDFGMINACSSAINEAASQASQRRKGVYVRTVDEYDFLEQSNAIEGEFSETALEDAMKAWNAAKKMDALSLEGILDLHRILLHRLNPRIAGRWRMVDVTVGGRFCPFVSPALLEHDILKWIDTHCDASTEETIKKAHVEFEKIHPFEDGNGRVGRLLLNYQRVKASLPILIINVGKDQQKYYKWFR